VDLSDAVTVLGSLFLGAGPVDCLDAADSDDSGALDITDPIFVLGVLFLGSGEIPPPSAACGTDPTADGIGCGSSDCP
jgi:hypothetical protein